MFTSQGKRALTLATALVAYSTLGLGQTTQPAAPVAAEQPKDSVDQIKQPTDWFKWGADLRLRHEYHENAITLNHNSPLDVWNYQRYRARIWGSVLPTDGVSLNGRLTWEGRYWWEPNSREGFMDDYIIPDQVHVLAEGRIHAPEQARAALAAGAPDDCIGCDQCAMACPVDCITIETIKSTPDVDLGLTSVGTKTRLYVPTFDIDIAKCCYCGLCVYPCPTECIKMTDVYEFSEYERQNLVYNFAIMTPADIDTAKSKLAAHEKEQAAKKAAAAAAKAAPAPPAPPPANPPAPPPSSDTTA